MGTDEGAMSAEPKMVVFYGADWIGPEGSGSISGEADSIKGAMDAMAPAVRPMPDLAARLRAIAEDRYSELSYHDYLDAADEIEKWRTLAMDWMKIAAVLICPDDDDIERLAWASGEGWDALQQRTTAALGLRAS